MKKLRSLLFLLLALCCLTVSVSAWDITVDPNMESNIEAEISEIPTIGQLSNGIAAYSLETRSGDGFMLPADTAYGATFIKDTTARISFIVEGCRSDQYIFAILMDEKNNDYVRFVKKLSEINASPDDRHMVTLPIDLKKYKVPLGTHSMVFGIIDEDGSPITGHFEALEFSVVSNEIPLERVTFYDAIDGFDLTEFTVCPDQINQLGLIYTPENASGNREVIYQSSDENVFTISSFGGYVTIKPVSAGTAVLTATVNGKVTASLNVSIGHNYTLTETSKAPTCTQDGSGTYQCSYCGDSKTDVVPALGHTYGSQEATVTQEATACKPGKATNHCTRCNQDIDLVIPAIFSDTTSGRFYSDAVDYFYNAGIINGMNATEFGTATYLSRGMLVTFLYRMAGQPACDATTPFTDVEAGRYFTTPIAWAYSLGITKGSTETTFEPMKEITREELATFIYRYATNYKGLTLTGSADLGTFPDAAETHNYAKTYVAWAVSVNIISGSSDNGVVTLMPRGTATRAQAATMLYRYLSFEANQPQAPDTPDDTQNPGDSETPDDTQTPGDSETPDDTQTPGDTNDPTIPDEDGAVG